MNYYEIIFQILITPEVDTYKKSKPLKTPIPTDIEAHRV